MRVCVFAAVFALLISADAASADCNGEFTKANKMKVEAGPFRVTDRVQTIFEIDGKKSPAPPSVQMTEFVPPTSVHFRKETAILNEEWVFLGKEGWTKEDASWKSIPASEMGALVEGGVYETYFYATELTDLVCHGESVLNGRKVHSYSYNVSTEGLLAPVATAVTVYFDAETGRPLASRSDKSLTKSSMQHTETVLEFDPSIKIERPQ